MTDAKFLIGVSSLTIYLFLSSETSLNRFFEEYLNIVNYMLSNSNSTTKLQCY